jgi:cytochrome c biogenesis protein CcdA/DsbC/DsbD-like thiol-disulfide interchange protein
MAIRPAILFALLLALPASAQDEDVAHTKIVSKSADRETVKPGETFNLKFTLRVDPNWHIYSVTYQGMPTEWKFEGPVEAAGPVVEPKPKQHKETLPNGNVIEYGYHEGEASFTVPVRLTPDAPGGPFKIKGAIKGLECDPSICLGMDIPFEIPVTVEGGTEAAPQYHTRIVSVTRDGDSTLVFKVSIDPGWHIYSAAKEYNKTHWVFDGGVEVAGDVVEPAPKHEKKDFGEGSFLEYWYHEGDVAFRVPVRGLTSAPAKGRMVGQECENVCVDFQIPFSEGATAAPPPPPAPPPSTGSTETADEEAPQSLLGLLVLGVIGGLVSLVMPCVYPLLPITLTYFIKQGGESRARSVAMSTAYALGIIIVFTGVGFLFSLLMGADGPRLFAANPWVNVIVALLFFWFAFSLFGLYEITLPSWLTGAASGRRSGIGGAFILGALFSIVTFTCTIPIAATILGVAATSGAENRFAGLTAMVVYSVTMAAPFFVLGLFPTLLKEVPKSGGWLHTVKVTAGFAELALAMLYLAKADQVTETNILTRTVMIAIWVAVLAVMMFYLIGLFRMKGDDPPGPIGLGRALVALTFGVLAVFMGTGFNGKALGGLDFLLPARPAEGFQNLPDAMAQAKAENKPVFVEFTGFT